ncbi:MAG: META domain-containing protein [bacterium]|nr:META domain-containing protein [bacterium]
MTRTIGLLAALALVLVACGTDSSDTTDPNGSNVNDPSTNVPGDPIVDPVKLAGTRWVATKLFIGGAEVPIVPNAQPTINFEGNGREAGGTTGCNSWFGEVTLGAGTITFGGLGQTEMACEQPLMAQESNVLLVLQNASIFTFGEGTLTIGQLGGSTLEFIDRAVAFPDVELTGTQWIADTIITGQAASTLVQGTEVTLFLDAAESRASGSAGCNNFMGSFESDRTQVTFGPLASTKMLCGGDGVMDQEAFVLATLSGELEVQIEGDRLTLTAPTGDGLSFRAQA